MNIIFNGTHVPNTPIVGVKKYFEGKYIGFYYAVGDTIDEGLELYFHKSAESDIFYSSRRYSRDKIPEKYKEIFNTLKSNLPKINELPGNPMLSERDTIKVDIEAFI